jgi:hypothetical protein
VRQCCALQTRAAMLPSLLETRRTPKPAGDWPTVPMPYCWSTRIFQISCAFLLRPSDFRPDASVYRSKIFMMFGSSGFMPCLPPEEYQSAYFGPNAAPGMTGTAQVGNR